MLKRSGRESMNLVNLIYIGDEVKNLDDMSREEREKAAEELNGQALRRLGYRPETEEKAGKRIGG